MVEINTNNRSEKKSVEISERRQYYGAIPEVLPVLPLRNSVVFPYTVLSINVGQPRSLTLLEDLSDGLPLVVIVASKKSTLDEPNSDQVYKVGCIAKILRANKRSSDNSVELLIQGLDKIQINSWLKGKAYLKAKFNKVSDLEPELDNLKAKATRSNLTEQFKKLVSLISYIPTQLVDSVSQTHDYRHFTYLIASSIRLEVKDAQSVLEKVDIVEKMEKLTKIINHEISVFELGKKIQKEASIEMEKSQREYLLRQQLKAIRKELGEDVEYQAKIEDYKSKIAKSGMSEEAINKAEIELVRLQRVAESSSEHSIIMTYLDWLTSLPWNQSTKDNYNISEVRKVLNDDHYGLEKIKERILEYIAVKKLKQIRFKEMKEEGTKNASASNNHSAGIILCFVGPPGIGKTSLGYSIARALGRKLTRISLGGIRDEAEIRGHRRTYLGALPGRFISAFRDAGTNNPVMLLDEVDKLGANWHGDPSSAMLEVLDPAQNSAFRDHYLDVAFDLSRVMFIATANISDNIPVPLMDRMETVVLSGYTDEEKMHIAQDFLLVRQKRENGLRVDELTLSDDTVLKIIRDYTREAGVRSLERRLATICRKVAISIAENKEKHFQLQVTDLEKLLGKPMFYYDIAERIKTPGVATGLGVTAVGGEILFVEVSASPGKKGLTITGQLGDVMRESVETALSLVRSRAASLGIETQFFDQTDLHFHLPAGAIPKDGPSAGITLVVALVSLLTRRRVDMEVGMTGEITLRGLVLPVGGIKEKILAANRANLNTIILPKRNEKDLDDLPMKVREKMNFVLVSDINEVLDVVFH